MQLGEEEEEKGRQTERDGEGWLTQIKEEEGRRMEKEEEGERDT